MSRPRKPTAASYGRLVTSVHQAERGVQQARKRHCGQGRAIIIAKSCMTSLLKYERWARQFGVRLRDTSAPDMFGRAA